MTRDGKMAAPACAVLNEYFKWITSTIDIPVDLIGNYRLFIMLMLAQRSPILTKSHIPIINIFISVYLRSSPEVVYNRMMYRNRSEEKCVPFEYIKDLHKYHEDWLYNRTAFSLPAPVSFSLFLYVHICILISEQ